VALLDNFYIPTGVKDMDVLVSTSREMLKCRNIVLNAANIANSDDCVNA
jgi:hypothetical protein